MAGIIHVYIDVLTSRWVSFELNQRIESLLLGVQPSYKQLSPFGGSRCVGQATPPIRGCPFQSNAPAKYKLFILTMVLSSYMAL